MFSEVQHVQRETLYFISNLDAFPQMFSILVVTTDGPLVPKTRDLVTKGLSENGSLPAEVWARLRSKETPRD